MPSTSAMWIAAGSALACTTAGVLAYGVRGRSSSFIAPSVYQGPADRRAVALTFDDGPSGSTPRLLEILERHRAKATFFECGANIRRFPQIARAVVDAGHEIGNHTDTHPLLSLQPVDVIRREISRAQDTIRETTGFTATLFRAPYGVRWFGMRQTQRELGLMGVMWTAIGLDWKLDGAAVSRRLLRSVRNGAILCLHDGRGIATEPNITSTIEAVRTMIPFLLDQGFRLETVSQLLCPTI
ncbi:MAG: polysaccharide deacetylase family protein [Bryobacteraceae bacterium]